MSVLIASILAVGLIFFISYPLIRGAGGRDTARSGAARRPSSRGAKMEDRTERGLKASRQGALRGARCPACGAAAVSGDAFCSECGEELGRQCAACGMLLRPGAAFCRRFGSPVSGPKGEAGWVEGGDG